MLQKHRKSDQKHLPLLKLNVLTQTMTAQVPNHEVAVPICQQCFRTALHLQLRETPNAFNSKREQLIID